MTQEMTVEDIRAEGARARRTIRESLVEVSGWSDRKLGEKNLNRPDIAKLLDEHDAHDASIPGRNAQLDARAQKIVGDPRLHACMELAERIAMQAYATGEWDVETRRMTGPRYGAWGIYIRDLKRHADGLGPEPEIPAFPKIAADFRKAVAHFAAEAGLTVPASCLED